jgi:hypothetical protein
MRIVMDIIKGIEMQFQVTNQTLDSKQGESSQVNIRGNNNDVNVNQAQNTQSGSGGSSYHGANPRCAPVYSHNYVLPIVRSLTYINKH